MTRRAKIWLYGSLGLLGWLILAWVLATVLGLEGSDRWLVWGGLALLGAVATGVLLWYFLKELREEEGAPPPTTGDEIDIAIQTARQRLRTAKYAQKTQLGQLPIVLCLGPVGSGKTTTMVRSGLDPDLLAGEIFRGDALVATRAVNLWYSNSTIFLEAGGRLTADAERWTRLVKHLQPSRMGAVFSAGAQAPRGAVVCFSVEEMLKPGAGEVVVAAARDLRARLLDVSQRLGIRLPVYVVFTKADRIAYFSDFVRNFSAAEAREVLGTTLPWDSGPAGTYADRTANRVANSLQRIANALATHRLQFLPRETQPEVLAGGYEFAREFRKLVPLATQFLVDLCKPSQLEVSPILRGFYFSGVRAVIVEEGGQQQAAQARQAEPMRLDATQAFVPALFAQAKAPAAPAGSIARKVPEWVFLGRLFKDVILRDRVALAATGGGARVNLLRRVLLGAATVFAVLYALGLLVSFARNRRLQHRVETASRTLLGAALTPGDVVALESLARLDSVRALTAQLGGWEREGAPLGLRWGLYSGSKLYPDLRWFYFKEFDSLLYAPTRTAIARDLRSLPDVPTDSSDYGATYELLKAHLVTTAFPEKSTPEFLAPVLTRVWSAGRDVGDARRRLAEDQFAFYGAELPLANPFLLETDSFAVLRGQSFLRQFKSGARIYQFMLSEAARAPGVTPFDFPRAFPSGAPLVLSSHVVPGAFTRQGWAFMQQALKDTDRYFVGEEWVLGGERLSDRERQQIVSQIRGWYRADYAQQWRTLLAQARIASFGGIADAAKKLIALGGNPSPLLLLINAVSRNVAVDSQLAATSFQPALVVSPPDSTKLIGEKTQPYMTAVLALGTALEQVAGAPSGQNEGPAQDAKGQAASAKNAARNIALAFTTDSMRVSESVLRLLLEGLDRIDPMLGNVGVAGLNRSGNEFCRSAARVLSKAPFNPGAGAASLTEINDLFQRNTGAIWTFYNDVLTRYLAPQGDGFGPRAGTGVKVNARFVEFMSKAAQFSRAIYPEGQPGPRVTIGFRPFPSNDVRLITLALDGQSRMYTQNRTGEQLFTWVASEAQEVRLEAQIGGNPQKITRTGTWGVFELFAQARRWKASGSRYQAEWVFQHEGREVAVPFELNLQGARPIFDPGWLRGLSCVGTIATP